ncbi:DUF6069 family protein [Natronoglycomyces albus]|uniref:Uncharacterized protein n=1 Tax=Natronoglycomyces albus TaxID=2811108 RepID=A0A895XSW1_9ACTN|nr:DUF6069 family protein [Natronoglycomyces albus]QSB05350.1 hypothetical protein JQS30_16645 [Natronoglycomyces albus]
MTEQSRPGQPTRKFTPGEASHLKNQPRGYTEYEQRDTGYGYNTPNQAGGLHPQAGQPGPDERVVDAGKLWSGGVGTAVIASLVVLVGILLVRGVLAIPVLAPEDAGTYGTASTTSYAFGAFGIAILATGLLHMMLMFMPSPISFFNWILGLMTLVSVLIPFTMNAEMESQIATASINVVTGICIISLLNTVANIAVNHNLINQR